MQESNGRDVTDPIHHTFTRTKRAICHKELRFHGAEAEAGGGQTADLFKSRHNIYTVTLTKFVAMVLTLFNLVPIEFDLGKIISEAPRERFSC